MKKYIYIHSEKFYRYFMSTVHYSLKFHTWKNTEVIPFLTTQQGRFEILPIFPKKTAVLFHLVLPLKTRPPVVQGSVRTAGAPRGCTCAADLLSPWPLFVKTSL